VPAALSVPLRSRSPRVLVPAAPPAALRRGLRERDERRLREHYGLTLGRWR